jgi:hypothetical protein
MTTRGFQAGPGDVLLGHMALMDWGLEKYRVDLDYLKVDIVDAASAGPDLGAAVPYHPPVPDPEGFAHVVDVAHDGLIDLEHADVNLDDWGSGDGERRLRLLSIDAGRYAILRWDLTAFRGRTVADHGLLELTTYSVERKAEEVKDFGLARVVEIVGGDPGWDQRTVTATSLCRGQPLDRVLNPQMVVDWPVTEAPGGKTMFTISRPVLQRLIDGRSVGLAVRPLGALHAAFHARENDGGAHAARLRFDLEP